MHITSAHWFIWLALALAGPPPPWGVGSGSCCAGWTAAWTLPCVVSTDGRRGTVPCSGTVRTAGCGPCKFVACKWAAWVTTGSGHCKQWAGRQTYNRTNTQTHTYAPEPHQERVDVRPFVCRQPRFEGDARLLWCFCVHPPQGVANAVHVDVHADADVRVPRGLHGQKRHLRADALERNQFFDGAWDVAVVGVQQNLGCGLQVLSTTPTTGHQANIG